MKPCILALLFIAACQGQPDLTVKKSTKFTKPVIVNFRNNNPKNDDRIVIFNYSDEDDLEVYPSGEAEMFSSRTCRVMTWPECEAVADGTVTFNGVDPSEEVSNQWPMNPRKYKVCHVRGWDEELIQPCKVFEVKFPNKMKNKTKSAMVKAVKEEYEYKENIVVEFNANLMVPNGWVGLYDVNSNGAYESMWLYTGCNNVEGDQTSKGARSNDCMKTKKKGKVRFRRANTGRSVDSWPLDVGEYYVRLEYYNNYEEKLSKTAEKTIKIVDSYSKSFD